MFRSLRFILGLLAVLGTTLALADPPARVGRLALVENEVNFRVDRSDAGGPASINWPISSGAEIESEQRGRAEIWIGSNAFRLAGSSELHFPVLDDRQISAQLRRGTLTVSILEREQSGDVTVQTPEGRLSFAGPGRYRIDVLGDHTELTTQAGLASFDDGERRQPVGPGEIASFYGGGRMQIEKAGPPDAFDRWVASRENAALANAGPRHVSPAMTGYQDLDAYGDWQSQPDYGAVWYPRAVAADWAPYRYGRWAWIEPWGWTWVDQAPWGFAPFHYGRWVQVHGRWGWVPGRYVARPVYAPALVAWIGNPGWSISFGFGSAPAVGWFPLAPREVYVPGFRASPAYVRQINVTHVHDVTIIDRAVRHGPPRPYAYRDQPRAVTVVPARNFREGRPITAGELGRHDPRELARAPQARPVPDAAWLPRPPREERREVPGGRANESGAGRGRDATPLMRPPASERLPEGRRDQQPRLEMQQREMQQRQEMQRREAEQQESRRRDEQRLETQQREVQQRQDMQRREAEQQESRRRDEQRMEMQQREAQQRQDMQRREVEQQEGRRRDEHRMEMQQREAQQRQDMQRREAEQQEGRRREQQRMETQQREVQQRQDMQRREAEQQEGRRREQQRLEMQQREVQQRQDMQRREAEQQEGRRREQQRMETQQREVQQRQDMQRREAEQQEGRRREQQRMETQQREVQQRQEMQRQAAQQQEAQRRDQQRMEMQQREMQQRQDMQRQEAQQQEGRRREQQRMEAQQREMQQRQEPRSPESRGGNREGGERGPR